MFLALLLFWILLNGRLTGEIFVIGLLLTLGMFLFACRHLHYSVKRDLRLLRCLPVFLHYILRLVREILTATMQVLRFVYSPKYEPEPVLVEFDMDFRTRVGQTLLANYITLTPGTITVNADRNHFQVHCLDDSFAPDPADWPMAEIIRRMEETGPWR